jgi:AcrR family transcriptional regulator
LLCDHRIVYGDLVSTPGPRPRFTVEEVVAAALRVIDAGPPDAFTMRRVADELGIGVMTLYGYVASKEELLEGATLLAFAQAHVESDPGGSWDERVRHEVRGLHDLACRHPHLVTLVLEQRSAMPGLFRMRERMLDALLSVGLDPSSALRALGVLVNYALGFASAQAGAAPIDLPERIRELPADEFPRLSASASVYAAHLSDEAFESGLEWLMLGLTASAGRE